MIPCVNLFQEGGEIARQLHGYEARPQQLQMVEAVEQAISDCRSLIVEAGTGVGKSLAYLVPFIDWAVREEKKVVISTYTKALQNQLFVKDLPFLSRVMDFEFRYAICMGSENYVCLRKARKSSVPDLFETKRRKKQADDILRWVSETDTGLATDMDFVPDSSVWGRFSRESDLCLGQKCPHNSQCFYRKARQRQSEAHVLVTNHALLFTDLVSETGTLPDFHGLVLDEAHTLENVATGYFGKKVSSTALDHMIENISGLIPGKIIGLEKSGVMDAIWEVKECLGELHAASEKFFKEAETVFGKDDRVVHLEREYFFREDISKPLVALSSSLRRLNRALKDPESRELTRDYAQRCDKFAESLEFILGQEDDKYVYWAEIKERKRETVYSFRAAPIDVSEQMRPYLFDRICPVVLTSATLSSSGGSEADFGFIRKRLGLEDCLELAVGSPFDYAGNVLVYLPREMSDPNKDFGAFQQQVTENILNIFDIMKGRIFALFTSYAMLNAVASRFAEIRPDINILKQGDLPRYVLLDAFKKNRDCILLGTTTFWQGVDVPGSALECVIITKLPFSVPSDPVNAARIRSVRDMGLNPFYEYQLPQAIIMFRQGFGRLIRSHSDRGVVAVLDPRVRLRYYGKQFLKALPKCRRTDDIGEVAGFFRE